MSSCRHAVVSYRVLSSTPDTTCTAKKNSTAYTTIHAKIFILAARSKPLDNIMFMTL